MTLLPAPIRLSRSSICLTAKAAFLGLALTGISLSSMAQAPDDPEIDKEVLKKKLSESQLPEKQLSEKQLSEKLPVLEKKQASEQKKISDQTEAALVETALLVETKTSSESAAPEPISSKSNVSKSLKPELSPNDSREVDYFVLPNNLPVLLISDPDAEKAAAALDVNVGSGDDPLDRAGLAHFLEHMLFLGTQKYPDAEAYQAYIKQHGGSHNAYTSMTHTNYFFEVGAEHLNGALDRFAQFFIHPLFNEEYVDRERNAVHSEFRSKFSTEYRRQEDVLRQFASPQHPLARFRTGNLDTLHNQNGELRQALIDFYQRYYSASNMRLVVSGKESLVELKKMVLPLFGAVKDFDVKHVSTQEPLYTEGFLPASVSIVPYSEVRQVQYRFLMPKNMQWLKKPLGYLGFLLGHEGEGSLLWLLHQRGWASALSAGRAEGWRDGEIFTVSINLSPEGLQNIDQVDALMFAYIDQVATQGIEAWRFEELKNLGEIDLRFAEKRNSLMEVSHLARKMQDVGSTLLFTVDHRLGEFDKAYIQSFAARLTPDNLLRVVTAPEVSELNDADVRNDSKGVEALGKVSLSDNAALPQKPLLEQTALYQTPYRLDKHYSPTIQSADKSLIAQLKLPEKNSFVPQDLSLINAEPALPERVMSASRFDAWHAVDTSFSVPKALLRVRLKSALVEQDVHHAAMVALLADVLRADINPVTYQASMASANFGVAATQRGLDFNMSGYSDSLEPLLDYVLKRIRLFGKGRGKLKSAAEVKSIQQNLIRSYRNQRKTTPYRQMMGRLAAQIYSPYWSSDALADALENVTHDDLVDFTKKLFKQSEVTTLTLGNLAQSDAKKIAKKLKKSLVKGRSFKPKAQAEVALLSGAYSVDIAAQHKDHAALLYFQGKDDSLHEQASMRLFAHMLSAPFYSKLRTEQQLGYIVFGSYYPVRDMPGAVFLVQSPGTEVAALKLAMESFLSNYTPEFETAFRVHQLALVAELAESPKNLTEQTSDYWQSINNGDTSFDRKQQLIEVIEAMEPSAFAQWYTRFLALAQQRYLFFYSQSVAGQPKSLTFKGVLPAQDSNVFKAQLDSVRYR